MREQAVAELYVGGRLPTMYEIVRACAERFSLTAALLRSGRIPRATYARHVAMFLCRVDARRSYSEIGRFFERDHTTIIAADRKIFALRENGDAQIEADLQALRHLLAMATAIVTKDDGCAGCRQLGEELARAREELAIAKQEAAAMRVRFGCG